MIFTTPSSLKKRLHAERPRLIQEAISTFTLRHSHDQDFPEKLTELKKRLEAEATRVYPMVDESILNERFKRAKKTAFITGGGSLFAGLFLGTITSLATFFMPFIVAALAYYASINTIKTSYNARVKGAMSSVVEVYEKELATGVKTACKEVKVAGKGKNLDTKEGKFSERFKPKPEKSWAEFINAQKAKGDIALAA